MQSPKVLLFDIETTPITAYTWGPKWETNLLEFIDYSRILSFSAKWFGNKNTITRGWPDYKGYKPGQLNDKEIVKEIWAIFNEADVILAHNGNNFDIRIMNARFAFHELTPPSPYKVLDTKTEVKKHLRLPSYKLDDICDYFKIGRKLHHEGFPLWIKCMAGDEKAWNTMLKYNKLDVLLLEKIYLKIRPWIVNHPNVGMYKSDLVCPRCSSQNLKWEGWYRNKTTKYHAFSCSDCGGWGRDTKNVQKIKPVVAV